MPITDPHRPHATNLAGHPVLYPCSHCGQDFGGKELRRRHRHRRADRCLTPDEMMAKGLWMDRYGRWRQHRDQRI